MLFCHFIKKEVEFLVTRPSIGKSIRTSVVQMLFFAQNHLKIKLFLPTQVFFCQGCAGPGKGLYAVTVGSR